MQIDALGFTSVAGASFGAPPAARVMYAALTMQDLGVLSDPVARSYLIIGGTLVLLGTILAVYQAFKTAWCGGPTEEEEADEEGRSE